MTTINNITEWCETIFGIGNYGFATWGTRNCKHDQYSVIWSTTHGKFRKWEKDSWNPKCSSTKLMTSITCKEARSGILITSIVAVYLIFSAYINCLVFKFNRNLNINKLC